MSLTSVIRYVRALDTTSTTGAGKSGLTFGDVTAKYLREGSTLTSLTTETITALGTYQAPTSNLHVRIRELAGSNPTIGIYEVHFHNDQLADTARRFWLFLSASGALFQPLEVDLRPYYADLKEIGSDPQSATDLKDFADAGYDPDTNYIAGIGGTTNTFDELQTALNSAHGSGSWESGGAGTGARVVTITVNDGSTVLENAKVRMTNGAESYVVSTNSSGVAAFALDDATWTVSITKPLYTFTSTTLVVNGTETQTYSMTAVSIPASSPGLVSGYVYCYDETGTAESGVTVKIKITEVASSTGYAYDGTVREGTSDATGLVTFTNLFKGGTYKIWRGRSPAAAVEVAVAAAAVSPVVLTSFIGEA